MYELLQSKKSHLERVEKLDVTNEETRERRRIQVVWFEFSANEKAHLQKFILIGKWQMCCV